MVAEAELALEIEQGENDPNTHDRTLPFAFAKRHGVLIQGVQDNKPLVIYKKGISPQSLAEVRRFLDTSIVFSQVDKDFFDTRLQVAYESGATTTMMEGLDNETNLLEVAQQLPEPSDL